MGPATILVVDDQPVNVQILRKRLERENLAVIAAHSGEAAIAAVRDHRPDLILLDVVMPELDGIEVCRRLQSVEENRSTPIIFITARDSKEGKIEGLGVGAIDYTAGAKFFTVHYDSKKVTPVQIVQKLVASGEPATKLAE